MTHHSNPSQKTSELLTQILAHESEETKRKILEIVHASGIRPNDPMFLALIVMTHAKVAITPLPEKLEEIQRNLVLFRGRQAPPKPELKRVLPNKLPRQIPSLLTMSWMGVVRKDEGVPNVW